TTSSSIKVKPSRARLCMGDLLAAEISGWEVKSEKCKVQSAKGDGGLPFAFCIFTLPFATISSLDYTVETPFRQHPVLHFRRQRSISQGRLTFFGCGWGVVGIGVTVGVAAETVVSGCVAGSWAAGVLTAGGARLSKAILRSP